MIGSRPYGVRACAPRGRGTALPLLPLLVMALLYGLLAMHGLGGATAADTHAGRAHGSGPSHSVGPAHESAHDSAHHSSHDSAPAAASEHEAVSADPADQAHPAAPARASVSAPPGHASNSAHSAMGSAAGDVHTDASPGATHGFRLLPEHQHADECECGGADGHPAHADATCAASGVSGAPAMDAVAAVAAVGPPPVTGLEGRRPDAGGERAPPSLHRLQLLRI